MTGHFSWSSLDWWSLPGPSRFVAKVCEAANSDDGLVALSLPEPHPDGIVEAVAARIEETSTKRVVAVDASSGLGSRSPSHWLVARIAVGATGIKSVAEFLDLPQLQEVVVVIYGAGIDDWRYWGNFLRLLRQERLKALRPFAPVLIVIPPVSVPRTDLLSTFGKSGPLWRGKVSRLDTQVFATALSGWSQEGDVAEQVASACVVEIAGWDRRVATALSTLPIDIRMDPVEALIASAMGWEDRHPTWANGLVDLWDGHGFESAMSLARRGDSVALKARVWRAQASVLFPFLDRVRRSYVNRYRPILEAALPRVKNFNNGRQRTYTLPDELEFFDIGDILASSIPYKESVFLRMCNKLRHHIAHMDPAPVSLIRDVSTFWNLSAHAFREDCHGWDWPRNGQELTILIGPSGAGKSTHAAAAYSADEVVSSDEIRLRRHDSLTVSGPQHEIFAEIRSEVVARLSAGRSAVVDATNLKRPDRLANVMLAPADMPVRYVVINRSIPEKVATGGWRLDRPGLIDGSQAEFDRELDTILGRDGLPNVTLRDLRVT